MVGVPRLLFPSISFATMMAVLPRLLLIIGSLAALVNSADDDFVLGAYLPDYRDYIQVNQSAPYLSDLYLFSVAPAKGLGDKQLSSCCLSDRHYETAREARSYKAEHGHGNLKLWLTVGGGGRSDDFLHDTDGLISAIRKVVTEQQLDGVALDCESFTSKQEFFDVPGVDCESGQSLKTRRNIGGSRSPCWAASSVGNIRRD